MELTGEQIIGSTFSKKSSKTFSAVNPVDGQPLEPLYHEASVDEVDWAFRLAHEAFFIFRKRKPYERAVFLEQIADEILDSGDMLIRRCMQETALPEARLKAELGRTVNQLKLFAHVLREGSWVEARIDTASPNRKPVPKPDLRAILIPMGPVGVFGAGNFPLAFSVAGGDTASALAAGCPVVVKAHPAHPGASEIVGRAILEAARGTGMPEGVFSMVHGQSGEVGMAVVDHPFVKAIGFTGSFKGGKALFDAAVRRPEPIPVYAEMGSVNPVFLLPGALEKKGKTIARDLIGSVTLGVGQFCTNPGLVFVIRSRAAEDFINYAAREISAIQAGVMLTANIKASYDLGIKTLLDIEGVEVKGKGQPGKGNCQGIPFLVQATGEAFIENPRLEEEVFGPSTVIVTVADKDRLLEVASYLRGHLTATIHYSGKELVEYVDLVDLLENRVGRLIINGYPTGVEVCPAMHHGGPFPAAADVRTTSVGTEAIKRFARPICYQDFPPALLPDELKDENPLKILRLVNGHWTREKI